jgi:hypothetical protein
VDGSIGVCGRFCALVRPLRPRWNGRPGWTDPRSANDPKPLAFRSSVLTAKDVTEQDRARPKGDVVAIADKVALDGDGFRAEVRRAVSGRRLVA